MHVYNAIYIGLMHLFLWLINTLRYGCLFLLLLIYEYNTTVEFYWAPFESNSDDPLKHSVSDRIIMPESIKKLGDKWKGVEYLIFNT